MLDWTVKNWQINSRELRKLQTLVILYTYQFIIFGQFQADYYYNGEISYLNITIVDVN